MNLFFLFGRGRGFLLGPGRAFLVKFPVRQDVVAVDAEIGLFVPLVKELFWGNQMGFRFHSYPPYQL
jgi:hypothetical protein